MLTSFSSYPFHFSCLFLASQREHSVHPYRISGLFREKKVLCVLTTNFPQPNCSCFRISFLPMRIFNRVSLLSIFCIINKVEPDTSQQQQQSRECNESCRRWALERNEIVEKRLCALQWLRSRSIEYNIILRSSQHNFILFFFVNSKLSPLPVQDIIKPTDRADSSVLSKWSVLSICCSVPSTKYIIHITSAGRIEFFFTNFLLAPSHSLHSLEMCIFFTINKIRHSTERRKKLFFFWQSAELLINKRVELSSLK